VKIGLISDTHGYLDPRIEKIFAGVDHILHAGDIGPDLIIAQLGAIAPTTAVLGNNDSSPSFRLTEVVTLAKRKFLVHHIVTPRSLPDDLRERLTDEQPHVVVFGHSHKQFEQMIGDVLFLNPGYAGKPRFDQPRSVAVMDCGKKGVRVRFLEL
jgi:uncharacterized protein